MIIKEVRANIHDKEYTPRQMSKYRLDRKRQHAIDDPSSRTAELMGHIDWLNKQLAYLEYVIDEVISPMPVGLEDMGVDSFEEWEQNSMC